VTSIIITVAAETKTANYVTANGVFPNSCAAKLLLFLMDIHYTVDAADSELLFPVDALSMTNG
jgi:hypothetical protein